MPIDLYQIPGSAPCRTVRLAAAALGVDLNLKIVDLMAGEQLKPEFLKVISNRGIFRVPVPSSRVPLRQDSQLRTRERLELSLSLLLCLSVCLSLALSLARSDCLPNNF